MNKLKESARQKGHDHNIGALEGHCLFQMGQHDRACELYECALRLFAQPKCAHLLHVRLAISYDKMCKPVDDIKRCLLYVCSRLPTPYDWLLLGACYYKENSWTLAEECLSEANAQDRGIPDTWAYLTLINIRIGRPWIASQCYQQMLKVRTLKNNILSMFNVRNTHYKLCCVSWPFRCGIFALRIKNI